MSDKPAVDAVEREFWDRGRQFRVWDLPARAGDPAPVFVLLHGLGTASRLYHHTVHHLRPHGRILVVNMPGFGDLARPQGPMGIADFAESIGRVLARMGIEAPVLVGHSMGTQVAVELARQHQHLRDRMVLEAPVVHPRRRTIPRLLLAFVLGSLRERPGAAPVSIRGYLQMGLGLAMRGAAVARPSSAGRPDPGPGRASGDRQGRARPPVDQPVGR
ncbi:alpha/beta fold hydrolase [Luteococcus sediminum]